MPEKDGSTHAPPECMAMDVIGSYPGDLTVWCELPEGHPSSHLATYTWNDPPPDPYLEAQVDVS